MTRLPGCALLPLVVLCCGVLPVAGQRPDGLEQRVTALLGDPAVARAHWGVMVTTLDGQRLYGLNEAQFFQPASNAKLFTTAAAMALLGADTTLETRVVAHGALPTPETLEGDLYLVGGGDANLSGRTVPYRSPEERAALKDAPPERPLRYLEELADRVAATGLKAVRGDVVGDDTLFRHEPYAPDWSIDDAVWGYGAPVSALSVTDNQILLKITPGAKTGTAAMVTMEPELAYYTVAGTVETGAAKSGNTVHLEREIGSRTVRLYGSIAVDAAVEVEEIAIEDPALYGATALKQMLEARGIVVAGVARARHLASQERRGFLEQTREAMAVGLFRGTLHAGCFDCGRPELERDETVLATHRSSTVAEDVVVTNKVSQNLHAEMLLRDLGRALTGVGSTAQGARVTRQFLVNAGIDKDDFVFYDGSGLSGHDLVTPRATAKLLQFAATQPWFGAWKASLPVGGVDGSLAGRFQKEPLRGHVVAKTGTLGEARALSGYLECASGKTVIFSIMDSSHMPGTSADRETMDRIVAAIAAAH